MCLRGMPKHEHIYRSYQRNHKGGDSQDAEQEKIAKEKHAVQKMMCQSKSAVKRLDADNEEQQQAYEAMITSMKKTAGNQKTHQARLRELEKNKDFGNR